MPDVDLEPHQYRHIGKKVRESFWGSGVGLGELKKITAQEWAALPFALVVVFAGFIVPVFSLLNSSFEFLVTGRWQWFTLSKLTDFRFELDRLIGLETILNYCLTSVWVGWFGLGLSAVILWQLSRRGCFTDHR